jgi:hypothetical protein
MILARKFTQAEENDYERIAVAGGRLRSLLDAFAENRLPPEYGGGELAVYAGTLLAKQRPDGSFSSYNEPEELEPDVRIDAHRFVTWGAAAFLCRLQDLHPGEASGIEGLDSAICRALRSPAASELVFSESGSAEVVQQVEAALVLASGGIPARLKTDPDLAPELMNALDQLVLIFRSRLDKGDTSLPGGIEYESLFRKALIQIET